MLCTLSTSASWVHRCGFWGLVGESCLFAQKTWAGRSLWTAALCVQRHFSHGGLCQQVCCQFVEGVGLLRQVAEFKTLDLSEGDMQHAEIANLSESSTHAQVLAKEGVQDVVLELIRVQQV